MLLKLNDGTLVTVSFAKFTSELQRHNGKIVELILPKFTKEQEKKLDKKISEVKFLAKMMQVKVSTNPELDYISGFGRKLTLENWNSVAYMESRKVHPNVKNAVERWEAIYHLFMKFREDVTKIRLGDGTKDDVLYDFPATVWNYCQKPPSKK